MKQLLWVALILTGMAAFAQGDPSVREKQFNLDQGIAISGYDPVAYFMQNKAVKGSKEFAQSYGGVAYYFSSLADRNEFNRDPARYEPQYGGWCAYAMGKDGSKVEIDPQTFKIINGRLFLFYNRFFTNTLKSWNKDEGSLHRQADLNWQKLYH